MFRDLISIADGFAYVVLLLGGLALLGWIIG